MITDPHDEPPFRWHMRVNWEDGQSTVVKTRVGWDTLERDWRDCESMEALFPDHEGAAIFTRPCEQRMLLGKSLREQGHRVLTEVDDNYLTNPRLSVSLRAHGWAAEDIDRHLRAMCSGDGIVVSTEDLRDMYEQGIRKAYSRWFKNNGRTVAKPTIFVCRNHLPADLWPEPTPREDKIRVGWMGSPSHVWDVDLAWPALLYARRNGAEVWMVGYDPVRDPIGAAGGLEQAKKLISKRGWDKIHAWNKVGYVCQKWKTLAPLERMSLPLDIGLCPLRWDTMTSGKSDVKMLEYTASGAATVAANHPVYSRTIIHGETGLLAGSPSEMIDCVKLLMNDEPLRERLVKNAQEYLRNERGSKQLLQEWNLALAG